MRFFFLGLGSSKVVAAPDECNDNLSTASPTCSASSYAAAGRFDGNMVVVMPTPAETRVGVMRNFLARLAGGASMVAVWPGSQGGSRTWLGLGRGKCWVDRGEGTAVGVTVVLVVAVVSCLGAVVAVILVLGTKVESSAATSSTGGV